MNIYSLRNFGVTSTYLYNYQRRTYLFHPKEQQFKNSKGVQFPQGKLSLTVEQWLK